MGGEWRGMESTKLGEIPLSAKSSLVVSKFKGNDDVERIDIRLFVSGDKYAGPTKKGVTLPKDRLPDLARLLSQL
jgi:hypothetical protein